MNKTEIIPDYKQVVRSYHHCRDLLDKMVSIAYVSHDDDHKIRVMKEVLDGIPKLRGMDKWVNSPSGRSLL